MRKTCPKCGREYCGLENYCSKCGIELEKDPNRCTREASALCKGRKLPDEDLFCAWCGSPTTYVIASMGHPIRPALTNTPE